MEIFSKIYGVMIFPAKIEKSLDIRILMLYLLVMLICMIFLTARLWKHDSTVDSVYDSL